MYDIGFLSFLRIVKVEALAKLTKIQPVDTVIIWHARTIFICTDMQKVGNWRSDETNFKYNLRKKTTVIHSKQI